MPDTRLRSDVDRIAESLGKLPEPAASPSFIAVSGLPGTGKSYLCARLAERLPSIILESDTLRKVLFPSPSYRQPESARLFRAIHLLIERLLRRGVSVILDATNLSEKFREHLYSIADRLNVRLVLVRVEAPPELVRERLAARQGEPGTTSDADWAVYQRMKDTAEQINRNHYIVDTSGDITPVVYKIVKEASR